MKDRSAEAIRRILTDYLKRRGLMANEKGKRERNVAIRILQRSSSR